jgi:malate/lactate dehydrogenase
VKLGPKGIEQIIELDLSDEEQKAMYASSEAVREVVGVLTS